MALFARIAETFAALGDPSRVKICYSLLAGEMRVSDLGDAAGISESATSQHLRVLRNLRWVRKRKEGRMAYYSLADEHIRALLELGLTHAMHKY